MSSLADLPELVGFFSYSRSDDEYSRGALSRLRARIHSELRLQLGREVRLWQDVTAIPHGTLWEDEITSAVAESVFFIPIVTPSAVASRHCKFEFESFVKRESAIFRSDLVFPILYIRVPALDSEDQRNQNIVLKIVHTRQYADWTKIRQDDLTSPKVRRQIERFCRDIVEGLIKPWESPEERQRKKEAEARRDVEEEEPRPDQERRHKGGMPLGWRAIRLEIIEKAENAFISPIRDRTLFRDASLVLGVAARLPLTDIQHQFPILLKVGPNTKMNEIVHAHLPGISLVHLPTPPPQIQALTDHVYFYLDSKSPLWLEFSTAASIGMHFSGEWLDLQLELWAILGDRR